MNFLYGETIPPPPGFTVREQWSEFDRRSKIFSQFNPSLLGDGLNWGMWPFYFEEYVGDNEPILAEHPSPRTRLIMWRRISSEVVPKGWHQFSSKPSRIEAFAELNNNDHTRDWSESLRRELKKWGKMYKNRFHIEQISPARYLSAYTHSTLARKREDTARSIVENAFLRQTVLPHLCIWGIVSSDGEVVAGIVVFDSKTALSSYHIGGFISDKEGMPGMAVLMDYWYTDAKQKKLKFIHFGEMWFPGKLRSWKGFSMFKSKFNPSYVALPPILHKFGRGTLVL